MQRASRRIERLAHYLHILDKTSREGQARISSNEIGAAAGVPPETVRKDLSSYGHFGHSGCGYWVAPLSFRLRQVLRTDRRWPVAVIGSGPVTRWLMSWLEGQGFQVVAVFDDGPPGSTAGQHPVFPLREIPERLSEETARMAVITPEAKDPQQACELLGQVGIRGILNLSNTLVAPPPDVVVSESSLMERMELLAFHVGGELETRAQPHGDLPTSDGRRTSSTGPSDTRRPLESNRNAPVTP